jgi:hypothetical protein
MLLPDAHVAAYRDGRCYDIRAVGAVGAYRRQERTQFARAKADIRVGIGKVFMLGNWALNQLSSAGGSSFAARQRIRDMVQEFEETRTALANLLTIYPELLAARQQCDRIATSGFAALIDDNHAAWAASAHTAVHACRPKSSR